MHGARTRALHTSRRGPAIIILISISLPRFRRRDRARSVQVQVQVRRDPTRVAAGTVPPSRGGSSSGRRGCWGPSLLGIDVKPAASAVPSTRPDSLSRFFHACRRSGTRGAEAQSSNAPRALTYVVVVVTQQSLHISFGFGAYTFTPRAAARIGRWPAAVGPRRRVADAARSDTAMPPADAAAAPVFLSCSPSTATRAGAR